MKQAGSSRPLLSIYDCPERSRTTALPPNRKPELLAAPDDPGLGPKPKDL